MQALRLPSPSLEQSLAMQLALEKAIAKQPEVETVFSRTGSAEAAKLKTELVERGQWSQYLEVGIGPDAEVFSKTPAMASVGFGAQIGVLPESQWNNPEPEIVLAVDSRGEVAAAPCC
ncbi:hypothetical protein G6F40_016938 [Rhizopus arrhizus]|nr:hypothetical protein G6F40_016938 [Rhizopus arrhizus]